MWRTGLPILFTVLALGAPRGSIEAQVGYDHAVWNEISWQEQVRHHGMMRSGGPPTRGFDLKYHRFQWTCDPADSAIAGAVTSHLIATQLLPAVRFDLGSSMVVDSVTNGLGGGALSFSRSGDSLMVAFDIPLSPGLLDSVTVFYHGYPAGEGGFGSFAWGEHNGVPMIWTLSEPYGAKDWWPCKQDLNDKIDSIDAYVTTPNGYRAAGNGVLVSETVDGSQRTCHWRHRHPIDVYLIATAATNYDVLTDMIALPGGINVPMITYTWPEEAFTAGLAAGDVAQQMPLYSQLFGTYPFADEKYGHARFGWGGGMEHQTMTFVGGWWYELTAHELAHQWFGDKVTCGSWQDLWLNEGFATYVQGLCYDYLAPVYWHGWLKSKIESVTSAPDGSVFVTDTIDNGRLFDGRLTYNKGGMVLHMLRWVCGDTAFYTGVRNYLDDPALAYGTAVTGDLVAHLEATSGLDLTEFMDDWFTGEGYPTYTVQWTQDAGGMVSVLLDQFTSHPSVDFFEMPVPVRFKNSVEDSTVVLDHTFDGQAFSFHLPFQADSALFDPDLWLVSGANLVTHVPVAAFGSDQPVLFPNPVNTDQAWIHLGTAVQGPVHIDLFDAVGRKVGVQRVVVDGQRLPLDLSGLSAGSYIADLSDGARTVRMHFVKE